MSVIRLLRSAPPTPHPHPRRPPPAPPHSHTQGRFFYLFFCFIHSTSIHWVLGSEWVLGVFRWAADSSPPTPGSPQGQADVETNNSSSEDSERGDCVVSQEPHIYSPSLLPQINSGLYQAEESFRMGGVFVSSFFKELDHWLQSKTSLVPDLVTTASPLASYCLEHICQNSTLWTNHIRLPRGVASLLRSPLWRTRLAWDISMECPPQNLPEAHPCLVGMGIFMVLERYKRDFFF